MELLESPNDRNSFDVQNSTKKPHEHTRREITEIKMAARQCVSAVADRGAPLADQNMLASVAHQHPNSHSWHRFRHCPTPQALLLPLQTVQRTHTSLSAGHWNFPPCPKPLRRMSSMWANRPFSSAGRRTMISLLRHLGFIEVSRRGSVPAPKDVAHHDLTFLFSGSRQ